MKGRRNFKIKSASEILEQITVQTKYEGYIAKEQKQIDHAKKQEDISSHADPVHGDLRHHRDLQTIYTLVFRHAGFQPGTFRHHFYNGAGLYEEGFY